MSDLKVFSLISIKNYKYEIPVTIKINEVMIKYDDAYVQHPPKKFEFELNLVH